MFIAGACGDPNLINKTTYEGRKYTNTCQTFQAEVQALIDANSGAQNLRVAEGDNTGLDYTHLAPGQFEQRGDTLYFRLINDLPYGKYLQKDVAVVARLNFTAKDELADLESAPSGAGDSLIVTQAYWNANKVNPGVAGDSTYLLYRIPVKQQVNGKQISLDFRVVQLNKDGRTYKKVLCTATTPPIGPLGPLDAPCCTDQVFGQARPKSVVSMPQLDVQPVSFRYKGFTGTLDLTFPMNSVKFERKEVTNVIQNFLKKYEDVGYKVKAIDLTGYASQGGTQALNQNLSDRRARVVEQDLRTGLRKAKNINADSITITAQGKGEDWERFELLVKTANFTEAERNELLGIAASADDVDAKEAQLRKLPYWQKLVDEVLTYCRHTFVTFAFEYAGQAGAPANQLLGGAYGTYIPVVSPELYNVATTQSTVGAYQKGADVAQNVSTLSNIIEAGNEQANVYALRSTWHFGNRDVNAAIADLEKAQSLEPGNQQYPVAMLAYRVENAGNLNSTERMRLLSSYNDYVARFPANQTLAYNRAVLMDRVGFISGALAEYERLLGTAGRNAVALNNRGVARLKTNRVVEAESDFREALAVDPNLAEAHFNLGIVAAYKGLVDRAVQHLDQALAIRPEFRSEIASNPVFATLRENPKFAKFR